MNNSYRFISDFEPTDNELELLMKDVIIEVKKRSDKANKSFKELQKIQIKAALSRQKQIKNGSF